MEYIVRHGLVTYERADGSPETAFRGMTIDIDDEQAARLLKFRAIVPKDTELDKPGQMMVLPQSASDAQILSWVESAKPSEVTELIANRPELADRIRDAAENVRERLEKQHELLSGIAKATDEGEREAAERERLQREAAEQVARQQAQQQPPAPGAVLLAGADNTPGGNAQPQTTPPAPPNPDPTQPPAPPTVEGTQVTSENPTPGSPSQSPDDVIKGNIGEISKYLADHPTEAPLILEAENRRVEFMRAQGKSDEQPRHGVVRAVQAAAGHAGQ